jgi:hypothetical protein
MSAYVVKEDDSTAQWKEQRIAKKVEQRTENKKLLARIEFNRMPFVSFTWLPVQK